MKPRKWYYSKDGKAEGPFSEEEIIQFFHRGRIKGHDLLYHEQSQEWKKAFDWSIFTDDVRDKDRSTLSQLIEIPNIPSDKENSSNPPEDREWILLIRSDEEDSGVRFQQAGPYTSDQVKQLLIDGKITLSDHCWTKGFERWVQLPDIPIFRYDRWKLSADKIKVLESVTLYKSNKDVSEKELDKQPEKDKLRMDLTTKKDLSGMRSSEKDLSQKTQKIFLSINDFSDPNTDLKKKKNKVSIRTIQSVSKRDVSLIALIVVLLVGVEWAYLKRSSLKAWWSSESSLALKTVQKEQSTLPPSAEEVSSTTTPSTAVRGFPSEKTTVSGTEVVQEFKSKELPTVEVQREMASVPNTILSLRWDKDFGMMVASGPWPEGKSLDVFFEGVLGTLVERPAYWGMMNWTPSKTENQTLPLRFMGIVQGDYKIKIFQKGSSLYEGLVVVRRKDKSYPSRAELRKKLLKAYDKEREEFLTAVKIMENVVSERSNIDQLKKIKPTSWKTKESDYDYSILYPQWESLKVQFNNILSMKLDGESKRKIASHPSSKEKKKREETLSKLKELKKEARLNF